MMRPKNMLLVEDNPDDETLTLMALRDSRLSNEIIVARDGVEALDYLFGRGAHSGRDLSKQPHVVFLDWKLPKLDGRDVLGDIRADERTKHLPVVVLTSSNEKVDLLAAYGLGANSFVQKPVEFSQFTDTVKHLARYWLLVNEPPPPTD